MLFSDMKLNMEAYDLTTKQGRDKAMEAAEKQLEYLPEGMRKAVRTMLVSSMNELEGIPEPFLLVQETAQELEVMSKLLSERITQVSALAKKYGTEEPKGFGCLVHSLATADTYLAVAGTSLSVAAESLKEAAIKIAKLETKPKAENPPG